MEFFKKLVLTAQISQKLVSSYLLVVGRKKPVSLNFTRISQNARYSTIQVEFPVEFNNEHKNGVYYYSIEGLERGYVKIITTPGGSINTVAYNSGVVTENRESKVYYRPQY